MQYYIKTCKPIETTSAVHIDRLIQFASIIEIHENRERRYSKELSEDCHPSSFIIIIDVSSSPSRLNGCQFLYEFIDDRSFHTVNCVVLHLIVWSWTMMHIFRMDSVKFEKFINQLGIIWWTGLMTVSVYINMIVGTPVDYYIMSKYLDTTN